MDTKESLDPQYYVLNAIFASMYLVECMDKLRDTDAYRQEVRNKGNMFYNALETYMTKGVAAIWGVKDDTMYKIMDYYRNVAHKLHCVKPEDLGVIEALIDKYRENPEDICNFLNIQVVDDVPVQTEVV